MPKKFIPTEYVCLKDFSHPPMYVDDYDLMEMEGVVLCEICESRMVREDTWTARLFLFAHRTTNPVRRFFRVLRSDLLYNLTYFRLYDGKWINYRYDEYCERISLFVLTGYVSIELTTKSHDTDEPYYAFRIHKTSQWWRRGTNTVWNLWLYPRIEWSAEQAQ